MTQVGLTASRHGLTHAQVATLTIWLSVLRRASGGHLRAVFHHGDCVGGDEQGAEIAKELGYWIIGHPPVNDQYRAWFPSDETREPREYHDRNRDIVSESKSALFGCPSNIIHRRGGTWWTVNHAIQVGKIYAPDIRQPVLVIDPDGRIVEWTMS